MSLKRRTQVKKITKKQSEINRELKKVYHQIDIDRPKFCTGCLSNQQLSHSHLIPRSYNRDLVCVEKNIAIHCMSCHKKWERGVDVEDMLDFDRNMNILKELDESYYNLRRVKLL